MSPGTKAGRDSAPKGNKPKKVTPVMRQFDEAKAAHPDAILFFRLGDFYEMFHDDAVLAARVLNLTLTSRNRGAMDEVPMAGVPHHAAHGYIAKLLRAGYKVALCEQMADPSTCKGIVPRQVVRVITPGLVTDADQLNDAENHFLCAIDGGKDKGGYFGFAALDLSTGELTAGRYDDLSSLVAELVRSDPREILLDERATEITDTISIALPRAAVREEQPLADDDLAAAIDGSVEQPIFDDARNYLPDEALRAAGRALRFARRCTPTTRLPVRRIGLLDTAGHLRINDTAQRHLELVRTGDGEREGSLIGVLDHTVTAGGARMLRRRLLSPLTGLAEIRRRLDAVETFVVHPRARSALREALTGITDIERLSVRVLLGEATPRDLGRLRDGLIRAPAAAAALQSVPETSAGLLSAAPIGPVDLLEDLAQTLAAAMAPLPPVHTRDGGFISAGYDQELDQLRKRRQSGTEEILAMEAKLRETTGVPGLRIKYTRVFGWYVEITKSQLAKVPTTWRRKQTVAGGERYTFDELDALAEDVESADERALKAEQEVFERLVHMCRDHADRMRALAGWLSEWDVASALGEAAHKYNYCRPVVDDGECLSIRGGRHPVVERYAAAGRFVPNDTDLEVGGERLWLVTGPNMAGKSTLMRQVALIVLMAQMGSFVPATSARVGVVDRVLSRVGASDNLSRGESTFMVEMNETATILREASRRSLVILDEIGRGTSTYDGLAIAWAVAEHLHDAIGCRALFATHYHELTELANSAEGIANVSVSAREHGDEVVFLHTLVRGPASRSYGVAVARLAGLPESVLARSRSLLHSLEGRAAQTEAQTKSPQLGLFDQPPKSRDAVGPPVRDVEALRALRAVDTDRLTPLDALQLLARLKGMLGDAGA